jgi:hypothetical protein
MLDVTTMKVMDKNQKGNTYREYFWAAQVSPANLVLCKYQPGRKGSIAGIAMQFQRISNRVIMRVTKRSLQ